MKQRVCFIFIFLLLLMSGGCCGHQASETEMTPKDMAAAIQQSQQEPLTLKQVVSEDTEFMTWLSDYYLLQPEKVADGVICYADGAQASEIAVLIMEDEKDSKPTEEALNEYIRSRAEAFEGYAPQQAEMIKDGIVAVNGRYIALLICPESENAKEAFLSCFGTHSAETRTESVDADDSETSADNTAEGKSSYDAEAVLQAYRSGDDSDLSENNRRILDAAKNVIASEIQDDMGDYEKELAIHDFITGWSRFDYSVFGRSSADGFADGSDTPYGVLIDRSAMCHGYSSTFQLFMDMLDIECVTVFGIPKSNGVEHSWNMVKLDGEWYQVDCAWDDPIGGSPCHTYFNVTSDDLRKGSIHQWDESSVPEATGRTYAYDGDER